MTTFSVMVTGALPMPRYAPIARAVEDAGFDELHVADDLIMRPAWPILTAAALVTSRIRLGPFIVTPQAAHPVYHAANLVALDELSGGRAVGGIGRGGFNPMIGADRQPRPLAYLREAHELMARMMRGDRTHFSGEFFTATADLWFQPPPPRAVPLHIGTWGPRTARLAGRIAHGVKADCVASPAYTALLRAEFDAGRAEVGRAADDGEFVVGPLCAVSTDPAMADDAIRGMLALLQPFLAPMTAAAGIAEEEIRAAYEAVQQGDMERAKSLVPRASIKAFSLTGTPEEVRPRIGELIDAGADHISFGPPHGADPLACIRLLGEQVLPYFGPNRNRKVPT